jgi:hypothetical protein
MDRIVWLGLATIAFSIACLTVGALMFFASPQPSHVSLAPSPFCAGPTWHPMPEVAHGGRNVDPG